MSALNMILENFDDANACANRRANGSESVRMQQLRAAAYAEGLAAGEAAATVKINSDNEFLQVVAEKLDKKLAALSNDMAAHFCHALKTVIRKTFPTIAEEAFVIEASEAFLKRADFEDGGSVIIKTAPLQAPLLRKTLSTYPGCRSLTVEADDELPDLAVVAQWKSGGFELNLNEAINDCLSALEAVALQLKGEKEDDGRDEND